MGNPYTFGAAGKALLLEARLNMNFEIIMIVTTIMVASMVQYVLMRLEGAAQRRNHKENPYTFGSAVQHCSSRLG